MDLLTQKIERYYERLNKHRIKHQAFFADLLELIRNCEEAWGSVQDAPKDSQEMWLIRQCVENEPKLAFQERLMPDLPKVTVNQIRRQIPRLYEMGFDYLEISRILEIRPKYAYITVFNYRKARELA
ncbi:MULTISPECIES: hypothetical protein [Lentilactobacillus]|jgi:hypothetical protein|uniref:hypothetical protein n=1 Tax=Lentilactobacillus TaxID=2767893 RepID=UPI0011EC15BF|nr:MULTISPECIES: hypothetical protein [Lentilactobacillus]MDB1104708.1 hypothetical protein [Lentilactobacillus parabuchneri]